MRKRLATLIPTAVFTLVVGLVCGAGVVVALYREPVPDSLMQSAAAETVVASREYDDPQETTLLVRSAARTSGLSPVAGMVTSFECNPSAVAESGQSIVSIDGVPILGLFLATPLWRDLDYGTRGSDVDSLAEELHRLGYLDTIVDKVNTDLVKGFDNLMEAIDAPRIVNQRIPKAAVIRYPAAEAVIADCDVQLGSAVAEGDSLWSFESGIDSVLVGASERTWMPGRRVITIDTEDMLLDDDGRLTAIASLTAMAKSRDYLDAIPKEDGTRELAVTARLASPVAVMPLPPQALFGIENGHACVASHGQSIEVTIVGSQLGETLATIEAAVPTTLLVDLSPAPDAVCPE
jgi:hypothetical protein